MQPEGEAQGSVSPGHSAEQLEGCISVLHASASVHPRRPSPTVSFQILVTTTPPPGYDQVLLGLPHYVAARVICCCRNPSVPLIMSPRSHLEPPLTRLLVSAHHPLSHTLWLMGPPAFSLTELLLVCSPPLKFAPISASLTPIHPSGLDLDTPSSRKPSLTHPAPPSSPIA